MHREAPASVVLGMWVVSRQEGDRQLLPQTCSKLFFCFILASKKWSEGMWQASLRHGPAGALMIFALFRTLCIPVCKNASLSVEGILFKRQILQYASHQYKIDRFLRSSLQRPPVWSIWGFFVCFFSIWIIISPSLRLKIIITPVIILLVGIYCLL